MSIKRKLQIKFWRSVLRLAPGDMFAQYGKGKYVDVTRRLDGTIVINSHQDFPSAKKGTILLIPYQPNHGVMVEYIDENGVSKWRNHLGYIDLASKSVHEKAK